MTPNLSYTGGDLADLIARVEAATGGDRALDFLINETTGVAWRVTRDEPGFVGEYVQGWNPAVTDSLDAALALKDRVLPGYAAAVGDMAFEGAGKRPWATIWTPTGNPQFVAEGATPALALIAAALKALPLLDGGLGAARAGRVHDGSQQPIASEPPHPDGGAG